MLLLQRLRRGTRKLRVRQIANAIHAEPIRLRAWCWRIALKRIVSSKAYGFCRALRHKSPTGHEKTPKYNTRQTLYNLRSLSILTQKIVVEISGSGSDIRSTPTPTNYTYLWMILEQITLFVRLYSVTLMVHFCVFFVSRRRRNISRVLSPISHSELELN